MENKNENENLLIFSFQGKFYEKGMKLDDTPHSHSRYPAVAYQRDSFATFPKSQYRASVLMKHCL